MQFVSVVKTSQDSMATKLQYPIVIIRFLHSKLTIVAIIIYEDSFQALLVFEATNLYSLQWKTRLMSLWWQ